jgi:hypothetical protein
MEVSAVRVLRRLKDENSRLKKLLVECDLEVEVMKEIEAKKVVKPRAMVLFAIKRGLSQRRRPGCVRRQGQGCTTAPRKSAVIDIYRRHYG